MNWELSEKCNVLLTVSSSSKIEANKIIFSGHGTFKIEPYAEFELLFAIVLKSVYTYKEEILQLPDIKNLLFLNYKFSGYDCKTILVSNLYFIIHPSPFEVTSELI